jgi:hypothetical protein
LRDALEESMNIEAMERYPGSPRVIRSPTDENLVQLQGKISIVTEKIQQLMIPRPGQPQIWCTECYKKGHMVKECPRMRGKRSPQNPMGPSPRPTGEVAQLFTNLTFHIPTPYHDFPSNQASLLVEYCDIF